MPWRQVEFTAAMRIWPSRVSSDNWYRTRLGGESADIGDDASYMVGRIIEHLG